jgi:hypothetical protein
MKNSYILLVILLSTISCSDKKNSKIQVDLEQVTETELTNYLHREVILIGYSSNAKHGALLRGKGDDYERVYISDLEKWPQNQYKKIVTVSGTLSYKDWPARNPERPVAAPSGRVYYLMDYKVENVLNEE